MHQLTAREAELLAAETATTFGHHSLYVELEAAAADGTMLSFDRLMEMLQQRLHMVPALRRSIRRVPFELDLPWWIEDPNFDLDYHVRHIAVPGRADPGALDQLLGRLHERALSRSHPLWEIYLIDLPDGVAGLFIKVHHVLIVGEVSLDLLAVLACEPSPRPAAQWRRRDLVPAESDLLIRAGWSFLRSPLRSFSRAGKAAKAIPLIGRSTLFGILAPWIAPTGTFELPDSDQPVPRVSFNRTIGSHRRVARVSISVHDVRALRTHFDVRFNDVILALVAGSLRQWLLIHDELPLDPLVALTPFVVSSQPDPVAAALVPLATHRHDRVERLREIGETTALLRGRVTPRSTESIRGVFEAAPALAALASRLIVRTGAFTRLMPPFNVYVVNARGGVADSVIDGHRVIHEYPLSTLVDGTGLSVGLTSHGDVVDICFVSDRELVPDIEILASRLEAELASFVALLPPLKANARVKAKSAASPAR